VDFAEVSHTKLHGDDLVLMEEGLKKAFADFGRIPGAS
jgi:hypothetical protein